MFAVYQAQQRRVRATSTGISAHRGVPRRDIDDGLYQDGCQPQWLLLCVDVSRQVLASCGVCTGCVAYFNRGGAGGSEVVSAARTTSVVVQ